MFNNFWTLNYMMSVNIYHDIVLKYGNRKTCIFNYISEELFP